ncbi:MAG: hypothetical protein ACK559_02635, partial [bacterium]
MASRDMESWLFNSWGIRDSARLGGGHEINFEFLKFYCLFFTVALSAVDPDQGWIRIQWSPWI